MSDAPVQPAPHLDDRGGGELNALSEAEQISGAEMSSERDADERVDESGRESFPASDPPGFWAGPDEPRPASTS